MDEINDAYDSDAMEEEPTYSVFSTIFKYAKSCTRQCITYICNLVFIVGIFNSETVAQGPVRLLCFSCKGINSAFLPYTKKNANAFIYGNNIYYKTLPGHLICQLPECNDIYVLKNNEELELIHSNDEHAVYKINKFFCS